jgi:hypothetical protein
MAYRLKVLVLQTLKIGWTLVLATIAVAVLSPAFLRAQDDPNDLPLGDVARNLRKNIPSAQDVIDNDNLSRVMSEVASHRATSSTLLYSIDGGGKGFQVSAPDVTCSLSFTANAKSLLSTQYSQFDLPPSELLKLDGPATIAGDALQVSVFNGTDWHVSEVAVALTILKKADSPEASGYFGPARLVPAVAGSQTRQPENPEPENRSERRSDLTVLYRMRAAAPPSSTAVFSAPLNVDIGPGQEWHWAIVQAKGYPPQTSPESASASSAQAPAQASIPPALFAPLEASKSAIPALLPSNQGSSIQEPSQTSPTH